MNERSVRMRFKSMAALQSKAVFLRALQNARVCSRPYRHWLLAETLAPDVASGLKDWPHPAPAVAYALGRREENNATRRYVDAAARRDVRAGSHACGSTPGRRNGLDP